MSERLGRRNVVTGLGGAAALLGAASPQAGASGAAAPPRSWRPALEPQDDWMALPGRHRFAFDCTSVSGARDGLDFADTYFQANERGYRLAPPDLAVIVILRHFATAFAYEDRIWAKYGAHLGAMLKFDDPQTKKPPLRNAYYTAAADDPDAAGASLSALAAKGVHFAVCAIATRKIAEHLAGKDAARTESIRGELVAGLIPNAHLAAAGIVALNRTQERGYAIAHMG